jgi:hypothetical protein
MVKIYFYCHGCKKSVPVTQIEIRTGEDYLDFNFKTKCGHISIGGYRVKTTDVPKFFGE